ncbi:2-oxo-4-hydroxy-4-carboxy-5-ureidoimidazoline decarboxylase [Chitinophaga sancti]|uniref:2-oxo-4-hydroxy-4-carboxy-5-ureidoimidazoline decarboxylase n=1 Tax=Chitinophaga sancti TaxID=1004 RepID=A0A1K1SS41_9BACT|nr:2-oxo-4-hydroxy-4-carboxy-5-ureidoimidazoline decarboxylase [Chitinophaga sancti]WQD65319.1 2-oxo-4-hydroxy-4-carboxy-5-ureidoimidazoline decarboxylase [Chitinophaga sancti]WQG89057.1 2-oxo-4-hydroxy-4-carboxy-5-ureidoimidazoline decarboxylase [Chitinophaga sancti]SFW86903.1 2-oxo-4-hydroxy-4-carboxy-5-ureidoimidazoline decarboxylase [Chitinophaga sancti]
MTLDALNHLSQPELYTTLQQCCGAHKWVEQMIADFPMTDETALFTAAHKHWAACTPADGLEAFSHHPRIGDRPALHKEQAGVVDAGTAVLNELAVLNAEYATKFGYIFIVFATGKSASDMLSILKSRMNNTPTEEIKIAMAEQGKITHLRLEKLLS